MDPYCSYFGQLQDQTETFFIDSPNKWFIYLILPGDVIETRSCDCLHFSEQVKQGMNENELIITDTVVGAGKAAVKGALLTCQYEGFLEDGTKFDSFYDHGRPFQFVIGSKRVIKGWDVGLMGMREGGKRTLFVPSHLGYGEREKGKIKPHSNLIFHVELLEVRPRED